MKIPSLNPQEAQAKLSQGATLIDIRSADEYAHKHITGAVSKPLDGLQGQTLNDGVIIFSCLGGVRTEQNAPLLKNCASGCQEVYLLNGGLNAWEKAGLPITQNAKVSLDIMRQVQIAAGTLILIGVILGAVVSPAFYGLSGFVGAGLLFAGLTGFCGMAKLLAVMPWNKV
jgi:rhodanese-related sulfurtransferase